MDLTVLLLGLCWHGVASSINHEELAPVVSASSSQYIARTFNRLVEATPLTVPAYQPLVFGSLEPAPYVFTTVPVSADTPSTAQPSVDTSNNQNSATPTTEALVNPLLISAQISIPSDIGTPQFQFLPLDDNRAQNIINVAEESSRNTETLTTNSNVETSFQLEKTSTHITGSNKNQLVSNTEELTEETQKRLEKQQQLLESQQKLLAQQQLDIQQRLINQNKLREQLSLQQEQQRQEKQQKQHDQENKLQQLEQAEQQFFLKQQDLYNEYELKREELLKLESLARENQLAYQELMRLRQQFSHQFNSQQLNLQQQNSQQQLNLQQKLNSQQQINSQQQLNSQQKLRSQQQFQSQQQLNLQQKLRSQQQIYSQQQFNAQNLLNSQKQTSQLDNFRTTVEVVPVPLAYVAPPPQRLTTHSHLAAGSPARIVKLPANLVRLAPYRANGRLNSYSATNIGINPAVVRPRPRDVEATTVRAPSFNDITRPPRR